MQRVWLSWLAIAWLMCASVAGAQSDPGRDAEARGLFEAGRAAFDQGRYQDALGYFDRAYQLSRRPQLLYNIGQVHDRLRHDEEALQAFQQYLKQVPNAQNRVEVEHRIGALRQAMSGMLHFTITPAGAQVWIDGEAKVLDASGRIQVSTGSHEIVVRHEGYAELRQRMSVRGGDVIELPVSLSPLDAQPAITPATATGVPAPISEPSSEPAPSILPPDAAAAGQVTLSPAQPVQSAPAAATSSGGSGGGGGALTTLGVVALTGGGVLLITGTVAALLGKSAFDDLNDDCSRVCTEDELDDKAADSSIETYELLTNVGLIGGGLLAGVGAALLVIGAGGDDDASAQPALVIGPTSIMARGSF